MKSIMMYKFTFFRKTMFLCLMALVAQVGFAEDRVGNTLVYDFTKYHNQDGWGSNTSTTLEFSDGGNVVNSLGETMKILKLDDGNTGTRFAVGELSGSNQNRWYVKNESSSSFLYSYWSGYRRLSIMGLSAGQKVTITFYRVSESNTINLRSNNVSGKTGNKDNQTGSTITSEEELTMSGDGSLDLWVGRYIAIQKVVIDDGGVYFNTSGSEGVASYNGNTLPLFRCRLSSRNFTEPTLNYPDGTTATYAISTIESPSGYTPAILNNAAHDVMMNNLGISKVIATVNVGGTSHTTSYFLEIYDDVATTAITDITNGKKFTITGAGVLHNRTISSVPGVEVGFSVAESGETHNTAVAYDYDGHKVAFTNDDSGWWDRFPHNNGATPTQGTFYSFKATAKGKLRFGGVKIPNNTAANDGKVYLVKIITGTWPQAKLFDASQTGYLSTNDMVSSKMEYNTNNTNDYTITLDTNNPDNNGIILETGHTYYLQGEANSEGNKWAPFLLEWFSYELDTELQVNKNFAVADKTGYTIGDNGTYTASDITVTGANATVGEINCKGNISSATVTIVNSHLQFSNIDFNTSGENNMGGAIRVKLYTSESNYIYVTLTIPYGKHVWDFRSTAEQAGATRPGAWSYSNEDLCSMMKANGTDWKLVWKVTRNEGTTTTELTDPIMAANSSIEGNNAFYMDNTAGLVFQAGPRSFGAFDTRNCKNVSIEDKNAFEYNGEGDNKTTETSLLWMKGEATIYFPGVTANQYIKIYTYRHADGKGETYRAKNLVDLDNVAYDGTTRFIMRGMWEQRSPGYVGDNIKGCAIFRVPSGYSATTDLASIPQLTLCDDGWVQIYRIEIMDEFEPDLIMTDDTDGTFYPVDYDGKYGSVVIRKKGDTITPTTRTYLATTGQTQCQHANTCDFQVIASDGVVTANREIWNSSGGVNYNKLTLNFNNAGRVRIVQRERANASGYAATTAEPSASLGYVIDKNEYYINVGELTVQDYPYTWDFTNHNMYQGSSATKTTLGANDSHWVKINNDDNIYQQQTLGNVSFGTGTGQVVQNLTVPYSYFAQGAQLSNAAGTAIAETEGLGITSPTKTKTLTYFATVNDTFGEQTRTYEGYDLANSAITINGNWLTGVKKIMIPEVPNGYYIFISVNSVENHGAPIWGQIKAGDTTIPALWGDTNPDIFGLKGGVYCYIQNSGSTQDVTIPLDGATGQIKEIAVTNIVKNINELGYASESRNHAIDHTYQERFTKHPVKAYAITRYNGETDNFNNFTPQVKKSANPISVVPEGTGVVLYQKAPEQGESDVILDGAFSSPLFYPAVNVVPTNDDTAILATNWMRPSVTATTFDSETETWNDVPCTRFIMTRKYYTYTKNNGFGEQQTSQVEAFYRLIYDKSGTDAATAHNTIGANKAYLLVPTANVPEALWNSNNVQAPAGIFFLDLEDITGDNGTTAIDDVIRQENESINGQDVYYSLSGVRIIGTPTTKGIYIKNGKKVSIK